MISPSFETTPFVKLQVPGPVGCEVTTSLYFPEGERCSDGL